jgi:hypothetical protein
MGSAIVNNEDTVSGILIAGEPLTHLGDENILEPGPEDGPTNKSRGLGIDGHLLVGESGQGDVGIDDFSMDYDQWFQKRSIGADTSDMSDSLA